MPTDRPFEGEFFDEASFPGNGQAGNKIGSGGGTTPSQRTSETRVVLLTLRTISASPWSWAHAAPPKRRSEYGDLGGGTPQRVAV